MITAADVMTRHVEDIDPGATVAEAIAKMREKGVSSLFVRSGGGMSTWGFITQTDVIEKVVADGLEPSDVLVHEIMSRPVITVDPSDSLQECAAVFARANIRRTLVFDGQNIVGIVSSSDIFGSL
jgi:CBS domain-containing protein